jgi:hypothetical protein
MISQSRSGRCGKSPAIVWTGDQSLCSSGRVGSVVRGKNRSLYFSLVNGATPVVSVSPYENFVICLGGWWGVGVQPFWFHTRGCH